ncbi:MAG: hypothetical protein FWC43_04880, partial [Planctomycetaceae bacterium]|nr:hypothetical protein [Planctomycetaceae bacterium]
MLAIGISVIQDAWMSDPVGVLRVTRDDASVAQTIVYGIDSQNSAQNVGLYPGWATIGDDFDVPTGFADASSDIGDLYFDPGVFFIDIAIDAYLTNLLEDKTIRFALLDGGGSAIDPNQQSTDLVIHNHGVVPQVRVDSAKNATKGVENGYIRLYRDNPHASLTVQYALSNNNLYGNNTGWARYGTDFGYLPGVDWDDYYYTNGSVTFAAGQGYVDIVVTPIVVQQIRPNDKIELTLLGSGSGSTYTLDSAKKIGTMFVVDNRVVPQVKVDSTKNAEHGVANGYVRLYRDNTDTSLTVYYILNSNNFYGSSGWAQYGSDFTCTPAIGYDDGYYCAGSITFTAGQAYVDIVIAPVFSPSIKPTGKVELILNANYSSGSVYYGTSYTVDSAKNTATAYIVDNRVATQAKVWVDSTKDAERGVKNGYVRLYRDNTDIAMTVHYTLNSNNYHGSVSWAQYNSDFTCTPAIYYDDGYYYNGSVTFAAGQAYVDIVITPLATPWIKPNAKVELTLNSTSHAPGLVIYTVDSTKKVATVFIADNRVVHQVWIDSVQDAEHCVGDGYFRLYRDKTDTSLTVSYVLNNNNFYSGNAGWAQYGTDFTCLPAFESDGGYLNNGSITFAAGQAYVDIVITPIFSPSIKPTGKVELILNANYSSGNVYYGTSYTVDSARKTATALIVDNRVATQAQVWVDSTKDAERGVKDGYVRLYRDNTEKSLTVQYALNSNNYFGTVGWAEYKSDFAYLTGVDWDEYNLTNGSVTFAAGQAYVDIAITPLATPWIKPNAKVELTLSSTSYAPGLVIYTVDSTRKVATVFITDNRVVPQVWIDSVVNAGEPVTNGKFILKRSNTAHALTVTFTFVSDRSTATYGTDFTISGLPYYWTTGSVTFAAGSDTAEIVVNVIDDSLIEGPETVTIQLSNPPTTWGGEILQYTLDLTRRAATLIIVDDDAPPTAVVPIVWIDSVVHASEPATDGKFVLKRNDTNGALTVQFQFDPFWSTATYGADMTIPGSNYSPVYWEEWAYWPYGPWGTVTFANGSDTAEILVEVIDDTIIELTETVAIRLTDPPVINGVWQYELDLTKRSATLLITDDEVAPKVWVDSVQNGEEGVQDGYFRLTRDNTQKAVTVYYNISGTATSGSDYKPLSGTVTFNVGEKYVNIPIEVIDDSLVEETYKTVILALQPYSVGGVPQYTLDYSRAFPASATLTIKEDDLPPNVWIDSVQNGEEGLQDGYFRLARDNTQNAVTVYYDVTGGTATSESDYKPLSGTVTFNVGEEYVYIHVEINDDKLVELEETVIITLRTNVVGGYHQYHIENTTAHPASATLKIIDNDAVTVWLEKESDATEGGEPGWFLIRRDNAVNELTVRYSFDKKLSTATLGVDFETLFGMKGTLTTGTVTFAVGVDTIRIPVITIDDAIIESTESVVLTLQPSQTIPYGPGIILPTYEVDPANSAVTVWIYDNEVRPTVWVDDVQHGKEGGENGYIRLRRDSTTGSVRIYFQIDASSTAIVGEDFEYLQGMNADNKIIGYVTFGVGTSYVDIPIRIIDDSIEEETETVTITLLPCDMFEATVNAVYDLDMSRTSGTVFIYDNDKKPVVWIGEIQDGTEGGANGYVRVYRDIAHSALTVRYIFDVAGSTATNGVDFAWLPGTSATKNYGEITFAIGQTYVDIPINVIDDHLIEGTETVRLILTTGLGNYEIGTTYEAIVNIFDNDVPATVRIDSIQNGIEGSQNGYIRLYRDRTDRPLTVYFEYDVNASSAALGQDFSAFPGMMYGTTTGAVTFGIGEHYVDIPIRVIDNTAVDGTRNILFRLHQGNPNDSTSYMIDGKVTAIVEIGDNDVLSNVKIVSVQDAREGETGYIRIYRDHTAGPLEIKFHFDASASTATFGTDFTFGGIYNPATQTGTVTFADGQAYVDLAVFALTDYLIEDDETVSITLLGGTGYLLGSKTNAVVTIFDTGTEAPVPDAWRVGVIASDPYASEIGPVTGEFTIIRTGSSDLSQPMTVNFAVSGTAKLDIDYDGINAVWDQASGTWLGTITFAVGQTQYILTVTPIPDNLVEGTETVTVTLLPTSQTDPTGSPLYTVDAADCATVFIEDAEPAPTPPVKETFDVSVVATDLYASEDGTNSGEFTIIRSGVTDLSKSLTVLFEISGNATIDVDYTGITATFDSVAGKWYGSVIFQPNQTHCVLTIIPLADDLVEGTETVILTLLETSEKTASGKPVYLVGSDDFAIVQIEDAQLIVDPLVDPPVRETWDINIIATDPFASENGPNSGEFRIVRSGLIDLSQPLTVWFKVTGTATINSDYTGVNATYDTTSGTWRGFVTLAAGQKYAVINVMPLADNLVEGTETVIMTLLATSETTASGQPRYVVGSAAYATVTIEDKTIMPSGTAWISGDPEIREGRFYTLDLHDNNANVVRWEITWGDGSAMQTVNGQATQATHRYTDGDANFTITVVAVTEVATPGVPTGGWQGLSHGYWKNHSQDWILYRTSDNYEAVFGVKGATKPGTMMEALKVQGGGINALWRESVAALLNAVHPKIQYRYSVNEIISMVRTAYATGQYEYYKNLLEKENTREGVDLKKPGNGGSTGSGKEEVRTTLTKALFVKNVAPDLVISGASKALTDTPYVLHLSSCDPGDDTITKWTINWGDGVQTVVLGNLSEVTHIYAIPDDYVITATALDEDGTWNANTVDVRVYEPLTGIVRGTPWISGDQAIYEGR